MKIDTDCPSVSIIIINKNYGKFISEAINSAIKQDYCNFEIIVVDDGSTDESASIIKGFADEGYIQSFSTNSRGPSGARNKGIKNAKGSYLAFLDSDDMFLPDKISSQVFYMKSNELTASYSKVQIWLQERVAASDNPIPSLNLSFETFLKKPLGVGGYLMSTMMIRRDLLTSTQQFDEKLTCGEDYDFASRIFLLKKKYLQDKIGSIIRIHSKNLSANSEMVFNSDCFRWVENFLTFHSNHISSKERFIYIFRAWLGCSKISVKRFSISSILKDLRFFKLVFKLTRNNRA